MSDLINQIKKETTQAVLELFEAAKLCTGHIMVIGCSTSEIEGHKIGCGSNPEIGNAVFEAAYEVLKSRNIFLAAQCCEHLNRAIVVERAAVPFAETVNAVPQPKAGGAFASAAYRNFKDPVVLEDIKADAGLDIGCTLIGMHLKRVAIPVRLECKNVGKAFIAAARTRPKYIGGSAAVYDKALM